MRDYKSGLGRPHGVFGVDRTDRQSDGWRWSSIKYDDLFHSRYPRSNREQISNSSVSLVPTGHAAPPIVEGSETQSMQHIRVPKIAYLCFKRSRKRIKNLVVLVRTSFFRIEPFVII